MQKRDRILQSTTKELQQFFKVLNSGKVTEGPVTEEFAKLHGLTFPCGVKFVELTDTRTNGVAIVNSIIKDIEEYKKISEGPFIDLPSYLDWPFIRRRLAVEWIESLEELNKRSTYWKAMMMKSGERL